MKCPNCQAEAQLVEGLLTCQSCGTFEQNDAGEWLIAVKPIDAPANPDPKPTPADKVTPDCPPAGDPPKQEERPGIELVFWDGRDE